MTTAPKEMKKVITTGIGSLPHHNVDSALEFSFSHELPYLPQIPIRNPWEFMIPQALEGIPGLQADGEGSVSIALDVWAGRLQAFQGRLDLAFSRVGEDPYALESFEPSPAASSCWQPFLFELEERGIKRAKVQIAGPLTSQWSLRSQDHTSLDLHPELGTQVFRLVLARALAMARRLRLVGVEPVIFLDEPALFSLDLNQIKHRLAFEELRILVQTLKKESIHVGIHCCSDTDWKAVLSLGINTLSIDAELSLTRLLSQKQALESFLHQGSNLSLGVIPTTGQNRFRVWAEPELLWDALTQKLELALGHELTQKMIASSWWSPSCGLALMTPEDAEECRTALKRWSQIVSTRINLS